MAPNDKREDGSYDLTIVHVFDAPRALVFRNWIEADGVRTWFAPDDCTVTYCTVDARRGGKWRIEYHHATSGAYVEYGEFLEITEPERLVFSLTQVDGAGNAGPRTLVTVGFSDAGPKTEMTFHQTGFKTPARREDNIAGWNECFRKLEARIANTAD